MIEPHQTPQRPQRVPLGRITAPWQAGFILILAITMILLWWFPLRAMAMAQDAQSMELIPPFAQHFLDYPGQFLLLPLPAVLTSAMVFFIKRGKVLLVCISWVLELIPMFTLVYIFVSFLTPLYSYQEL